MHQAVFEKGLWLILILNHFIPAQFSFHKTTKTYKNNRYFLAGESVAKMRTAMELACAPGPVLQWVFWTVRPMLR